MKAFRLYADAALLPEGWAERVLFEIGADGVIAAVTSGGAAGGAERAAGPVLADEFNGLLPLDGRGLEYQPLEYRQLAAAGLWEAGPLIAAIEGQSFAAILLYQPRLGPGLAERWAPELREAIYQHYETSQTLADTLIYVPRTGARP